MDQTNMKKYDYKEQLNKGKDAEITFIKVMKENYPQITIIINNGNDKYAPDFLINYNGELVTMELKTDFLKTGNFFFERYSNDVLKTNGGPWQADEKHTTLFCYWFAANTNEAIIFKTSELITHIENYIREKNISLTKVKNINKVTTGYIIPVNDFVGFSTSIIIYNELFVAEVI